MPFVQNLSQELIILKQKIESLEAENRQLRKGYESKLTNYIKTSHQLCRTCSKKIF